MLSETSLPIAEICMNCGFDSPSYFSRAFKSATDMSPSAYRKTVKME
jgi:AraC-like DNA-binding protein